MSKTTKILINGRYRETDKTLVVKNPYNNEEVATTYLAGPGELKDALEAAQAAFEVVKKMPSYKRAEVLQKTVDGMIARADELARTITLESGKPIRDARAETARAINTFQIALEESKRQGGEVLPLDIFPGAEGRFGLVRRFPVGVVLGISPFNFPLNLVAHKVAPAMACGCTIILKPASKTPLTALLLGEIISDAGWPEGALNVVPSMGADVERLLTDERIKKLTFTGSAGVGWRLKARALEKKVTLELGGNAGVIVHNDADIDAAAKRCTIGAFSFAGQICISVQRIYVEQDAYKKFSTAFAANAKALRQGDPMNEETDIGPMIEEGAAAKTEEWVKEAVAAGAKILVGGGRKGNFFEPTVITNTKPEMKVCGEELFAPVVILEPYRRYEDAVASVNAGRFGLQAGVFTKDIGRIMYAYENIDAGGIIINDIPTFRVDNMPYGGVKQSGFGREGVKYAIEEMTELKHLAIKA